jgi:hypothetical protein
MEKRVYWIEHKGKKILYVDYSGLRDEEAYLQVVDEFEREMLKQPAGLRFRTIVNVTDSVLTPRITQRNKEVAARSKARGIPDSPTALVGLTGLKMAVVQAMQFLRPDLHPANSIEEAKEWLVQQEVNG